jgi:hypothetical protein
MALQPPVSRTPLAARSESRGEIAAFFCPARLFDSDDHLVPFLNLVGEHFCRRAIRDAGLHDERE